MSSEPTSSATSSRPLIVRAAREDEVLRARQLFPPTSEPPPSNAKLLVALKLRPVERIVAALAWWKEAGAVRFLLARQPGLPADRAAAALVPGLEALPDLGGADVEYGRMLAEDDEVAPWLARHGYQPLRTERVLEAPFAKVYERVENLLARYGSEIPGSWKTESIRHHPPETIWPLVAPFRLIKLESLRRFWARPGERGYDPEHSNILFDGDTPLGTLLVRRNSACLAIDIRVVTPMAPRLRSLANLALFAHIKRMITPTTHRVVAFRGDQDEHGETINVARRMGGREVAVRHVYIRPGDLRDENAQRPHEA